MRHCHLATVLTLATLVAAPAAPGGEQFTAGSNVPDCAGVSLKGGCSSSDGADYSFAGTCKLFHPSQTIFIEASGSWDKQKMEALESIAVTGKGEVNTAAKCSSDPWATGVTCVVTAHNNNTGIGIMSPLNAPQYYPWTRKLVTSAPPPCPPAPPAPPPPPQKTKTPTIHPGAFTKAPASAPLAPAPMILSPSEGQAFPPGGFVTVQFGGRTGATSKQYEIKYERWNPNQRAWIDRTSAMGPYAQVQAAQLPLQIPVSAFPAKKLWRISAKGIDPGTHTSQFRQFELE